MLNDRTLLSAIRPRLRARALTTALSRTALILAALLGMAALFSSPSIARESRDIAATCEQTVRNAAQMHAGPALGTPAAEANYRECWESSVLARDAMPSNLVKICREELARKGVSPGTAAWDSNHRRCIERETARTAPLQAAVTTCLTQLRGGPARFGGADWDAAYDACVRRSNVDRSNVTEEGPKPFGRGKVQAYLNALYHGDLPKLRAIDAELSQKLAAMYQVPGYKTSLLKQVLANYLMHYPVAFRKCLPPDAPIVKIGRVVDRVTERDGVELYRQTFDSRRDVPVAKHLHALALRISPSSAQSDYWDGMMTGLTGVDLDELRGRHVNEVVAGSMNGLECTDPIVKQLDEHIIKFAPLLLPP